MYNVHPFTQSLTNILPVNVNVIVPIVSNVFVPSRKIYNAFEANVTSNFKL